MVVNEDYASNCFTKSQFATTTEQQPKLLLEGLVATELTSKVFSVIVYTTGLVCAFCSPCEMVYIWRADSPKSCGGVG